jgi:PAS domain S-box-containing protein
MPICSQRVRATFAHADAPISVGREPQWRVPPGSGVILTVIHDSHDNKLSMALQVLNAISDPVIVIDLGQHIVEINEQAAEMLGSDSSELVGTPINQLVPERYRDHLSEFIRYRTTQPAPEDEGAARFSVQTRTGLVINAEFETRPLSIDDRHLLLVTIRDITQHTRLANELRTNQMLLAEAQRVAKLGSWRWNIAADELTWSYELYRIFGLEPSEQLISYTDYIQIVHPADRERVSQTIQDAIHRRSSFEFEHRIVRPDGVVRLIYSQGAVSLDEVGELASLVGTAQDVTERKANEAQAFQLALEQAARQEAERTKERFQFLAEVSEALATSLEYETTLSKLMRLIIPKQADWCTINTLEPDGRINRLALSHRNPEKQPILQAIRERGFLPHGDGTHPLTKALNDGRPQLHAEVTDEMLQRMARSEEHLELARQLNPRSVMLVPLVARGRAFGVVTFGMSESGRRYTEDDLHLAIEVTHRAAVSIDNAHLYHEAQEAARAREEFVSLVSHELKTPLTVIKGYIQVMERYLNKPEWEHERIMTTRERLSTQVTRLELLVSDILDVSRMQRGRLDLNVVPDTDLVALAKQVVERFDDALERRPNHEMLVHSDGPVHGCWDPLRLDQVFSNLLSNALKYSPDGGPIDVFIRRGDTDVTIDIRDHGVGISDEEQAVLFQPFQRGAAASRGISGTGLGLYITKQIIEQHGGSISVSSIPGAATTFSFQLPLIPDIAEIERQAVH